jgi:hypothetical protein
MLRALSLCSACLFASALSTQAATQTLFSDNFAADSALVASGYQTVTSLTNWTLKHGNVDVLAVSSFCASGTLGCIDLDGTGAGEVAVLETKTALNFVAGILYTFTFSFAGGTQVENLTVGFPGGTANTFASPGVGDHSFTGTVASNGSGPITITMGGPADNVGPYLSGVLVTYDDGVAVVPLPAGAPLLLAGIGLFGAFARRRRG